MKTEPVAVAGTVSGLIMAGLAMAVSLGWLRLDDAQMGSIQTFVVALVGFAVPKTAAGQPAVLLSAAEARQLGIGPDGAL